MKKLMNPEIENTNFLKQKSLLHTFIALLVATVGPSPKTNLVQAACLTLVLTLPLVRVASAESIVFPADAGVKNVKDHGARGDGGGFTRKPMPEAAFAAAS